MTIAIQALLGLLEQLLPLLGAGSNVALIESIIGTLVQFMPFIAQEISALYTPVKNIIEALSSNPATNASQLATLQTLDKQADDAFEAAAAATDAGT
jgi:hypothetical protein